MWSNYACQWLANVFILTLFYYISAVPTDCRAIKKSNATSVTGNFTISPQGTPITGTCNMDIDGGGWTKVTSMDTGWSGNVGGHAITDAAAGVSWNEMLYIDKGTQMCFYYASGTCQIAWEYGFNYGWIFIYSGESRPTLRDDNYNWITPSAKALCSWTNVLLYPGSQWRLDVSGAWILKKPSTWNLVATVQKMANVEDLNMPCQQNRADNRYWYKFDLYVRTSYICNGLNDYNTNVCSGNGACIADGICQCYGNYNGTNCQLLMCPGMSSFLYLYHYQQSVL
jgi:hypothetical protein